MLYTREETSHYSLFFRLNIARWFVYKNLQESFAPKLQMDFWLKDKNKLMLFYKASFFLHLLGAHVSLVYRSSKQGFRYKFKPDTLECAPDTKFLLNLRHFMYFGIYSA